MTISPADFPAAMPPATSAHAAISPIDRVAAPLREQVLRALREAIAEFRFVPGQRLVERDLIEQLGVSRTTVREALRELSSEGLVTVLPQRGVVVTVPSLDDAEDLYRLRAVLESLVVRLFVERATDEAVQELHKSVEHLADVVGEASDVRRILGAKSDFYRVLIAGSASNVIRQQIEALQARVQLLRSTSLRVPGRATLMVDELRAVARAVADRDADRAAAGMAAHVDAAGRTAIHHLRGNDSESFPSGSGEQVEQ